MLSVWVRNKGEWGRDIERISEENRKNRMMWKTKDTVGGTIAKKNEINFIKLEEKASRFFEIGKI